MTKQEALFIKYLRIRLECTWRIITAMWHNRYMENIPFNLDKQEHTSQLIGRTLCRDAQIVLNENRQDEC